MRLLRVSPDAYPEDVLEREFERFASGPLNRFIATELVTLATAVRYCCGFRRAAPPGFSYVRAWPSAPLLLVAPLIFIIPEMVALDFALAREPWYWRLGSDALHVYAGLWSIGIFASARQRPHRCDAEGVRLRFALLKRIDVLRASIASVDVRASIVSARALRSSDVYVMALSGAPAVELRLRTPVAVRTLFGRTRTVDRIIAAADDPHAFAAALTRPSDSD